MAASFSPLIAPDKIDNAEPDRLRVPEKPKEENQAAERQEGSTDSRSQKDKTKETTPKPANNQSGKPVFKVQLFATDGPLKASDKRFKSLAPVDSYRENGLYKYTYGATTSYADIKRPNATSLQNFPTRSS